MTVVLSISVMYLIYFNHYFEVIFYSKMELEINKDKFRDRSFPRLLV